MQYQYIRVENGPFYFLFAGMWRKTKATIKKPHQNYKRSIKSHNYGLSTFEQKSTENYYFIN